MRARDIVACVVRADCVVGTCCAGPPAMWHNATTRMCSADCRVSTSPLPLNGAGLEADNATFFTDFDDVADEPLWRITTTGFLLCLVILFTLLGNGLVVIAVTSTRRLRSSVTNYFVVSLAVADLTVAVLVMPYAVVYELYGRWTFGWVFCYFWISCDVTCCTASILHLCVIALDRYIAVTEPLTYRGRMTRRRALAAVAGVWTCSSAISFVPVYAGWFVEDSAGGDAVHQMRLYEDGPTCGLFVNRVYAVISSTTSFYLPLVVMLVVYAKIYRVAQRQAAEIQELERSLRATQRTPTGRLQRRSRRVVSDTKAVKTLGTLMGLFCVSWLPFFVLYVVKPFCAAACHVPAEVEAAVTWLGYCNSFFNPCVYAFLNRDFRSAFRRVLCCGRNAIRRDVSTAALALADQHRSTPVAGGGRKFYRADVETVATPGAAVDCRSSDNVQFEILQQEVNNIDCVVTDAQSTAVQTLVVTPSADAVDKLVHVTDDVDDDSDSSVIKHIPHSVEVSE